MKSYRVGRRASALLALALAGACDGATGLDEGEFVGRLNGRLWVGDARAALVSRPDEGTILHVFGGRPRRAAWGADEVVNVRVAFDGPGVYELEGDAVTFKELVGGDGLIATYTGVGSPAGVLRITRHEGGSIEGELSFLVATTAEQARQAKYGPEVRFEEGKFRARVTVPPITPAASAP